MPEDLPTIPAEVRSRWATMPDLDNWVQPECPFCEIVAGRAPARHVHGWPEAIAIEPLDPVTPGHLLVIPRAHLHHAAEWPQTTGLVFSYAAALASDGRCRTGFNLVTSAGAAATQTVFHLHVHIVPRAHGDGLHLPWTPTTDGVTPDA